MKTVLNKYEMKELSCAWKKEGKTIAFVPTMGALHEGHLSLVRQAKEKADITVVSVFVNPAQFGPNEDFSKYPRTFKEDTELLKREGVDVVFAPTSSDLYGEGFQTWVDNEMISIHLCGASRPGHFKGVCTVVMKFFNIVDPDVAFFGKKDYQQFLILKKMVEDLDMSVSLIPCEILREATGLAMSSRNRYLQSDAKADAAGIYASLKIVEQFYANGERNSRQLIKAFTDSVEKFSRLKIEYVEIRHLDSFAEEESLTGPSVILVAVRLGTVRLIDNLELE